MDLGPQFMAKKRGFQPSKRFLLPRAQSRSRKFDRFQDGHAEVFPEGSWSSIFVNLELKGWTPAQITLIRNYLRRGLSLSQAINYASFDIGKCPVASQNLG
tara:strand:+ start:204 stop:506 length:303 start_codon:yes stop_codon:yes gene_type:complete